MLNEEIGLTMHPFDLATNKVLAMAGRLEVRDWVDVLTCDRDLQPLGYLVWAACGKDPGYNPQSLLAACKRQHYSQAEVDTSHIPRRNDRRLMANGERLTPAALRDPAEPLPRCVPVAPAPSPQGPERMRTPCPALQASVIR